MLKDAVKKKKTSLILQTLVSKDLCSELLSAHSWRPEQWWGTTIPFKWGADVWIQEGLWPRCNSGRALVYWNLCNPGPIVHLPRKNAQKTWSEYGLACLQFSDSGSGSSRACTVRSFPSLLDLLGQLCSRAGAESHSLLFFALKVPREL